MGAPLKRLFFISIANSLLAFVVMMIVIFTTEKGVLRSGLIGGIMSYILLSMFISKRAMKKAVEKYKRENGV